MCKKWWDSTIILWCWDIFSLSPVFVKVAGKLFLGQAIQQGRGGGGQGCVSGFVFAFHDESGSGREKTEKRQGNWLLFTVYYNLYSKFGPALWSLDF